MLIELNIETTRHQEIQVIGNGEWCLTLGGRDCSLQMHEQKLLEVSTTVESLQRAIDASDHHPSQQEALAMDLAIPALNIRHFLSNVPVATSNPDSVPIRPP